MVGEGKCDIEYHTLNFSAQKSTVITAWGLICSLFSCNKRCERQLLSQLIPSPVISISSASGIKGLVHQKSPSLLASTSPCPRGPSLPAFKRAQVHLSLLQIFPLISTSPSSSNILSLLYFTHYTSSVPCNLTCYSQFHWENSYQ